MLFSAALVLSLLPLSVFAGKHQEGPLRSRHTHHARSIQARNNTKTYKLDDYYRGDSFLNDWDFFSGSDPTHGNVNFLSKEDAASKKLAFVQADGTTVLAVDDTTTLPSGGSRNSVRISTKKKYNGGLFIADFWAMPHGCSVWPAYWSVGPKWPDAGEIDILEGVHEQPTNQYTLHTSDGCTLSTDNSRVSTNVIHDLCASSGSDNRGCGFLDSDTRTYGKGFNMVAGGVYAHLWNDGGIKMWHFARGEIPADITAKNPDPSTWGTPVAFWSSSACDFASHFYDHSLIIDTTLCGDWAGPSYTEAGCPGTCADAVADPANFRWAKWKLNYIAVYQ
ncbi:glycoside hydrolase family 16 protein [Crucibulum laeve]|uniref:Glycoside hydrolase family 16 protein n=1 Tax=Crucibulum laeve TaxID=68775 RepID=A0A5C3M3R4_9AGAR|nr:glycoside hydrolase family 16 protein [Crucibulum laeve]